MEKLPLNHIKVMLAERMLTNKKLVKILGKAPATISKWITNTSKPTLENLIKIAQMCIRDRNYLQDVLPVE